MISAVILPLLAFCIGIIAAMLGIGGGVFAVPALQLLPLGGSGGLSPQIAAGTSLAMIVFKAFSSTVGYGRQGRIDYKMGLLMATATVPGSFIGALLTVFIDQAYLILIFALFLLYVASRMIFSYSIPVNLGLSKRFGVLWNRRIVDSSGEVFEYSSNVLLGLILAFFAGISSGLLGIGGGSLMVPILYYALSFPMHLAVGTSVFIMIFSATSGVSTHAYLGNVQFDFALLLAIGVVFGAQIGALVSRRVSAANLRRTFGAILVLVGLRMILKFLSGA
ncbi:sulfite exporter TauE/SafE family protein [Candidatus Bathyarchaeota archaeon]|nr:sulfite exporter TauE/SafE family protein [Candidatus Bathyarchaeota archaeon]